MARAPRQKVEQLGMFGGGAEAKAPAPAVIVEILVWDVGTLLASIVPAIIVGERNGLLVLRIGSVTTTLGRDEVEDRRRRAIESRVWDARVARSRAA